MASLSLLIANQTLIRHVDPVEYNQVFLWHSPNWGWFFLGGIAGFFLAALFRRIAGIGG